MPKHRFTRYLINGECVISEQEASSWLFDYEKQYHCETSLQNFAGQKYWVDIKRYRKPNNISYLEVRTYDYVGQKARLDRFVLLYFIIKLKHSIFGCPQRAIKLERGIDSMVLYCVGCGKIMMEMECKDENEYY